MIKPIKITRFAILILLLLPAGLWAQVPDDFLNACIDQTRTELIAAEGPPDAVNRLEPGGTEMAYESRPYANRDYRISYLMWDDIVQGALYRDNAPESATFTAQDPNRHLLSPIGLSTGELLT